MQVNMSEAGEQLSKLGELAWQGEEIVIAKAGKPYLRLTPFRQDHELRKLGAWKGKVCISPEFDDDQDIVESFYNSKIFSGKKSSATASARLC